MSLTSQEIFEYDQKNTQSNRMWDADAVGPVYFCIYCFHIQKDYPAYCSHCGHANTVYKAPSNVEKKFARCYIHPLKQAVGWCDLCARGICEKCDNNGKDPKDYFAYTVNLQCKNCVAKSKELENEHKKHVSEKGVCYRHEDIKSLTKCTGCGIQLCGNCSYATVATKGFLLRKKIIEGPFCLTCLRGQRVRLTGHNKGNWKPYFQAQVAKG